MWMWEKELIVVTFAGTQHIYLYSDHEAVLFANLHTAPMEVSFAVWAVDLREPWLSLDG